MTKNSSRITAQFVPDESDSLAETLYALAVIRNPHLASALARSYPILMLVDELVLFLTWTNSNLYSNSLSVVVFTLAIRYWYIVSHACLPLLISLAFCWLAFHAQSSKEAPATIDDVLHTLYNLSVRINVMLSLFSRLSSVTMKQTVYWTPVYLVLTTSVISPRLVIWVVGCVVLTVFLPWAYVVFELASRGSLLQPANPHLQKADMLRKVPPPTYFDVKAAEKAHNDQESTDLREVGIVTGPVPDVTLAAVEVIESADPECVVGGVIHPEPSSRKNPSQKHVEKAVTGSTRRKLPPPFPSDLNKIPNFNSLPPEHQLSAQKCAQTCDENSTEAAEPTKTPFRRKMAPPPDSYVKR